MTKKRPKKKEAIDNDKKKKRPGQPTKFKNEYIEVAQELAKDGCTDKEIAELFNVTVRTVHNWKKQFPEFFHSLKKGKRVADDKVKEALFKRACGYSHPDVHISNYQGTVTVTPIIKHHPPDPACCIFWLSNRDPDNWKRNGRDGGGGDGGADIVSIAQTELAERMKDMK